MPKFVVPRKIVILFFFFSLPFFIHAQIQLGNDIDGETVGSNAGSSVSISGDGHRIIIGEPGNSDNGNFAGQARIFEWNGMDWVQIGIDIEGENANDRFGFAVSISEDGNKIAIGSPFNDANGMSAGLVKIYSWSGQNWILSGTAILGTSTGDKCGWALSFSGDGNRLAIGCTESNTGGYQAGQVRIFEFDGTNWDPTGGAINGTSANDLSGEAISLSQNGNRIAIGASNNDDVGNDIGQVRVFQYNNSNWVQLGNDLYGENMNTYAGRSVSLSDDGNRLAIGGPSNTNTNGSTSGHVRIYDFNSSSNTWVQAGMDLEGSNGGGGSRFGTSVFLSGNGNRIAIGAYLSTNDNGQNAGSVQIYDWDAGMWNKTYSDILGESAYDQSGISVSLSGDGERVAIGANLNDDNGSDAGHVRVFSLIDCMPTSYTDVIVSCDELTWIDGNTYTSNNQEAFYITTNNEGCDSTIYLDLTIHPSTSESINITTCEPYELNGQVYDSSGNYPQVLNNQFGCDSTILLNLNLISIDTSLTLNDHQLIANYDNASYQWLDCDSGVLLDGENNQTFTPLQSGNYAVEITDEGCSAISSCYEITISDLTELEHGANFSIFPNPILKKVNIDLGKPYTQTQVEIFNIQGQRIYFDHKNNERKFSINADNFVQGFYFIKITSGNNSFVKLLLKE